MSLGGFSKKIWYAPNKKEAYGDLEIQAVVDCLNDGWLAGFGPRTIEFEEKVSSLFSKKHGLFVNSGSSAILLGLNALNLNKSDEVITAACTFSTTLAPIIQCGLKPVFCDVEIGTYVSSPEQVCEKITEKTKVIILPNLVGSKPNWSEIRRRVDLINPSIILFEDSADTITSTPETDVAITSAVGYNMKSSEMNAAFGLVQISRIEEIRDKRKTMFNRYLENLKDVPEITLPINTYNSDWLAIAFMTKRRLELLTFLEANNIQTRVCFAGNVTRHPVYREYLQDFPNADRIMAEGFLLGAHHGMVVEDVDYVCDKIKEFFSTK